MGKGGKGLKKGGVGTLDGTMPYGKPIVQDGEKEMNREKRYQGMCFLFVSVVNPCFYFINLLLTCVIS